MPASDATLTAEAETRIVATYPDGTRTVSRLSTRVTLDAATGAGTFRARDIEEIDPDVDVEIDAATSAADFLRLMFHLGRVGPLG